MAINSDAASRCAGESKADRSAPITAVSNYLPDAAATRDVPLIIIGSQVPRTNCIDLRGTTSGRRCPELKDRDAANRNDNEFDDG